MYVQVHISVSLEGMILATWWICHQLPVKKIFKSSDCFSRCSTFFNRQRVPLKSAPLGCWKKRLMKVHTHTQDLCYAMTTKKFSSRSNKVLYPVEQLGRLRLQGTNVLDALKGCLEHEWILELYIDIELHFRKSPHFVVGVCNHFLLRMNAHLLSARLKVQPFLNSRASSSLLIRDSPGITATELSVSDCGLGYFPIAGPKNSSPRLELCHVVSFYFHICIFCPSGCKSCTGSEDQNRGIAP